SDLLQLIGGKLRDLSTRFPGSKYQHPIARHEVDKDWNRRFASRLEEAAVLYQQANLVGMIVDERANYSLVLVQDLQKRLSVRLVLYGEPSRQRHHRDSGHRLGIA